MNVISTASIPYFVSQDEDSGDFAFEFDPES